MHSTYKLILCANRDESFARETKRPHYWEKDKNVFGGKDLEKGGTWIGVRRNGKLAAVTNVRETFRNEAKWSRGKIVSDFLMRQLDVEGFIHDLDGSQKNYQGYNLIMGDGEKWYYTSNRARSEKLEKGIHVVSNASLLTDWPKTLKVKNKLKEICQLEMEEDQFIATCMDMLRDDEVFKDEHLPKTGVGLELERQLSSVFINGETYGTRASTIILIRHDGHIRFIEQGYGPKGIRLKKIDQVLFE
jgi:uncharacterized protein with NRDE domain